MHHSRPVFLPFQWKCHSNFWLLVLKLKGAFANDPNRSMLWEDVWDRKILMLSKFTDMKMQKEVHYAGKIYYHGLPNARLKCGMIQMIKLPIWHSSTQYQTSNINVLCLKKETFIPGWKCDSQVRMGLDWMSSWLCPGLFSLAIQHAVSPLILLSLSFLTWKKKKKSIPTKVRIFCHAPIIQCGLMH